MRAQRALVAAVLVLLGIESAGQTSPWPPVLLPQWSHPSAPAATATLIPGKGITVAAVAVDALDNVYVAGTGTARDVPGLERGFDASPDGGDAFVAKLDRNGAVVWATYLGGTDRFFPIGRGSIASPDRANAVAVDAAGQVHIAGATSANNFPVVGGFQSSRLGDADGFVATLSADGRRLVYSSYIGALGDSMAAHGIALGPAGDTWVQLRSPSRRWLAATDLSGGAGQVIVLKLNAAGSPIWSTRVGLIEEGGFAVDGAGRAYLAGPRCALSGTGGCEQALLRLDPSGRQLQYSASFANRNAELYRSDVTLLPNGRAAFSGVAFDPIPLRNEFVQPPAACPMGCGHAFLAIVDDSGEFETVSHLGLGETQPVLAADVRGRITVAVRSGGIGLPVVRPLVDHHVDGPIYVSRDRGTTFAVEARTTLPTAPIRDLEYNWARNTLYAAALGLFESTEDLSAWRLDSAGFFLDTQSWFRIAVDRRRPSIRYAIFDNDVFRRDAGDAAWRMIWRSPPGTYRRTVVVSPHDSGVWIAGNTGVAMSDDGGTTWIDRSAGLPNLGGSSPTVEHLEFDPQHAGVVYATTQVGLYRTRTNGAGWEHLTGTISPAPYAIAVAFDPITSDTIHLATRTYGMLRSTDAGRSWTRTLEGHRLSVVATDHMKRHIVYTGGLDPEGRSVFYRSIDRGASWHRAGDGLHLRAEPSRLLVDPRDSMVLSIGTSSLQAAPYIMRLQPDAANARRLTVDFATYLGHGEVKAMAATLSGGLVAAMTHAWPSAGANDHQMVTLKLAP